MEVGEGDRRPECSLRRVVEELLGFGEWFDDAGVDKLARWRRITGEYRETSWKETRYSFSCRISGP